MISGDRLLIEYDNENSDDTISDPIVESSDAGEERIFGRLEDQKETDIV